MPVPADASDFFTAFASTFDSHQPEQTAEFYMLPAVTMSDEHRYVHTSRDNLVDAQRDLMDGLIRVGVKRHEAVLFQSMRLSDTILFTNVRWRFYDEQGGQLFSCHTSYTLQRQEDESLRIMVSVIDDEEKQLAKLLNNKTE